MQGGLSGRQKADGNVLGNSSNQNAHLGEIEVAKAPVHQSVYRDLRARILFGDYVPGQALTIQGLARDMDSGVTPVREAIRRLTSEGALRMHGNRRLAVPVLTEQDIDELSFMRRCLEPELVRRAAPNVSVNHLAELRRLDQRLDVAIQQGDVRAYLRSNYTFHRLVYQIAASPILLESVERLWLRFGPSLRVVCGRIGTVNLPDKHADILTALENGDADAASRFTCEDVMQGMQQIAFTTDSIDEK